MENNAFLIPFRERSRASMEAGAVVGMIQILTGMLAFYLVIKGIEVLQIGLASNRPNRKPLIIIGALTLALCVLGGCSFVVLQNGQADSVSSRVSAPSL